MKLDFRQRLLATTLLVGASMVASPAFAQDVAPAAPCDPGSPNCVPETTGPIEGTTSTTATPSAEGENVESTQDIIVTGSRIPQPNLTSASPVTVVTSQEVKLQGTSRTEDLINSLPQSFAAQGSNIANGSTGTATVNLRGIGPSRTMVLITPPASPGDPRQPFSDLTSFRRRSSSASSADRRRFVGYGADALRRRQLHHGYRVPRPSNRRPGQRFMHQNAPKMTFSLERRRRHPQPARQSVNGGAQDIAISLAPASTTIAAHPGLCDLSQPERRASVES